MSAGSRSRRVGFSAGRSPAPYQVTIDYNLVEHSTVFEDGEHFLTQTDTFVPDASRIFFDV